MLSILINIGLLILILIALILLMIFGLIVACITAYIMYMVSGEKIGSFDGWIKIIKHKITMRGVTAAHSNSKEISVS